MAAPLVIGVDVGGTKILAGVVDRDGNVARSNEVVSPSASEEDVLAALDSSVDRLLHDRLEQNRDAKQGEKLGRDEIIALSIKTWNFIRKGEKPQVLYWRARGRGAEGFPEPE